MVIMSVDLGKARTGLAICDKTEFLASPYKVIFEKSPNKLPDKIAEAAKEAQAEMLVVGLPKNMDGTEGESAQNARALAEKVHALCGIPFQMQDERGTTVTAHGYLSEVNVRGKKRKAVVDAAAAVIILQNHLDQRRLNGT